MLSAVCVVPVAPVRRSPSHEAEMTSQLLFGETVVLHEPAGNGFFRITCTGDGYEGFCMGNQLKEMETSGNGQMLMSWSTALTDKNGNIMHVPFGSILPVELAEDFSLLTPSPFQLPPCIKEISSLYLNSPYLWGGRSVFGADCSGFTQMVMKASGIRLPRDASQQVECGRDVALEDAREGDLAFFDQDGKVVHVGIYMGDGEIIHAFGKVRRDKLDAKGIVNQETGTYTHSLYKLKTFHP